MRLDHEQGKQAQWTEQSNSASAERGGSAAARPDPPGGNDGGIPAGSTLIWGGRFPEGLTRDFERTIRTTDNF